MLRVILGFSLDDISRILDVGKSEVKSRLQRAKTGLKSYFEGRCQWTGTKADCSCESRIGFALAFAPDLLIRLRNYPHDDRTKTLLENSLEAVGDVVGTPRWPISCFFSLLFPPHIVKPTVTKKIV